MVGSKLLYEYIVYLAKEEDISGVTVYRGIMGFGLSSTVSSSKFWELTEKLPIVIELIDTKKNIKAFYKKVESELIEMPKGCLVTVEDVSVKLRKKGKAGI